MYTELSRKANRNSQSLSSLVRYKGKIKIKGEGQDSSKRRAEQLASESLTFVDDRDDKEASETRRRPYLSPGGR